MARDDLFGEWNLGKLGKDFFSDNPLLHSEHESLDQCLKSNNFSRARDATSSVIWAVADALKIREELEEDMILQIKSSIDTFYESPISVSNYQDTQKTLAVNFVDDIYSLAGGLSNGIKSIPEGDERALVALEVLPRFINFSPLLYTAFATTNFVSEAFIQGGLSHLDDYFSKPEDKRVETDLEEIFSYFSGEGKLGYAKLLELAHDNFTTFEGASRMYVSGKSLERSGNGLETKIKTVVAGNENYENLSAIDIIVKMNKDRSLAEEELKKVRAQLESVKFDRTNYQVKVLAKDGPWKKVAYASFASSLAAVGILSTFLFSNPTGSVTRENLTTGLQVSSYVLEEERAILKAQIDDGRKSTKKEYEARIAIEEQYNSESKIWRTKEVELIGQIAEAKDNASVGLETDSAIDYSLFKFVASQAIDFEDKANDLEHQLNIQSFDLDVAREAITIKEIEIKKLSENKVVMQQKYDAVVAKQSDSAITIKQIASLESGLSAAKNSLVSKEKELEKATSDLETAASDLERLASDLETATNLFKKNEAEYQTQIINYQIQAIDSLDSVPGDDYNLVAQNNNLNKNAAELGWRVVALETLISGLDSVARLVPGLQEKVDILGEENANYSSKVDELELIEVEKEVAVKEKNSALKKLDLAKRMEIFLRNKLREVEENYVTNSKFSSMESFYEGTIEGLKSGFNNVKNANSTLYENLQKILKKFELSNADHKMEVTTLTGIYEKEIDSLTDKLGVTEKNVEKLETNYNILAQRFANDVTGIPYVIPKFSDLERPWENQAATRLLEATKVKDSAAIMQTICDFGSPRIVTGGARVGSPYCIEDVETTLLEMVGPGNFNKTLEIAKPWKTLVECPADNLNMVLSAVKCL